LRSTPLPEERPDIGRSRGGASSPLASRASRAPETLQCNVSTGTPHPSHLAPHPLATAPAAGPGAAALRPSTLSSHVQRATFNLQPLAPLASRLSPHPLSPLASFPLASSPLASRLLPRASRLIPSRPSPHFLSPHPLSPHPLSPLASSPLASPHIPYAIVSQNCLVTTWLRKHNERLINHFGTDGSLAV